MLGGPVALLGRGSAPPLITRSTPGPVVTVDDGADISLEYIDIVGATTSGTNIGYGIRCSRLAVTPELALKRVTVRNNASVGLSTSGCAVTADESHFVANGSAGASIVDGIAVLDRCTVIGNGNGLDLDEGTFSVTNTIVARNDNAGGSVDGLAIYTTAPGSRIEFNTIVDNGRTAISGAGLNCNLTGVTGSFPNNIIARNRQQTRGQACTYPSSIIVDTDIVPLKFKSPDVAPFDYHITAGSIAVDAATVSTLEHDIDGEARPAGAGRDVGADELQ